MNRYLFVKIVYILSNIQIIIHMTQILAMNYMVDVKNLVK
jgi:hypothetical protein